MTVAELINLTNITRRDRNLGFLGVGKDAWKWLCEHIAEGQNVVGMRLCGVEVRIVAFENSYQITGYTERWDELFRGEAPAFEYHVVPTFPAGWRPLRDLF
jgi:hypothetical protein